ncbi:hypothetical protein [Vibrio phage phiKT1024]|nr:hypothetical protein [Vibrio phage phiKT1024]
MIDYQDLPRRSGKTRELAKLYHNENGYFIVLNEHQKMIVLRYGVKHHDIFLYSEFLNMIYGNYMYNKVYFDEFGMQKKVNHRMLIDLDLNGLDVYVRGSNLSPLPNFFECYLREKYPEMMF